MTRFGLLFLPYPFTSSLVVAFKIGVLAIVGALNDEV